MPDSPILEFTDVSLRYGQTWALRKVSLRLNPGETRIIFGEAGSGKTTLLKAVIGLVPVDQGNIYLFGQDVTSLKESELFALRSRAGFVFQEGGLFDSLSVGENVEYPLLNRQTSEAAHAGAPDGNLEPRVRETLRFVELEQTFDKFPSQISGGMRRRVGIARAIVTEPPLVLYDSPTAGLDPITANTIMALVAKERDTKDTANMIVTHRYQDGELMAEFRFNPQTGHLEPVSRQAGSSPDKALETVFMVLCEGRLVFEGSQAELEASRDAYVRRFVRH